MNFHYSAQGLKGREASLQRLFEVLPAALSWGILVGFGVLSFRAPIVAAIFIIAFDLYWLMRLFYATIFLVISYGFLHAERQTDWMDQIRAIDERDVRAISAGYRQKEFERLLKKSPRIPASASIRHLAIIPVAGETEDIIEPGIRSLTEQNFPTERILVILAVEGRASEAVQKGAERIASKYRGQFLDFLVTVHPDGLPGETRVKGANTTYAARAAAARFEAQGTAFADVVVSCFDADTVASRQYFACLTYHFMICPDRQRASFQPIPVYHNNIWEAPGFARVLETGSSFFLLIEAANAEKLVTFSSHSMSFKALVDVGYWPVDMISDDSAIFWKSFIHFDGDYRVVPMYETVSMDAVTAENWWKTARNVYRQKRRWAWGVENFPQVARAFLKSDRISFYDKAGHLFKLLEGHVAWATWAFLLTLMGWVPAFFSSREFSNSVLYYGSQRVTSIIFNLSLLSFAISIVLSLLLLPRKKTKLSLFKKIVFTLEWLFVPFIATFFGALPALDAQTRLALGKPLRFQVTQKNRLSNEP